MAKEKYEIRQIDALPDGESGWVWNNSYNISTLTTSGDPRRAFTRHLARKHNVKYHRGAVRIEYDGDIYEIQNRKTGEPLFAAIPLE